MALHVISGNREFTDGSAPILEAEHVPGHAPFDGTAVNAGHAGHGRIDRSCDSCSVLHQLELHTGVSGKPVGRSRPDTGHILRDERPVDPVLLRTAAREHQGRGDEDPRGSHRREPTVALDGPPEGLATYSIT